MADSKSAHQLGLRATSYCGKKTEFLPQKQKRSQANLRTPASEHQAIGMDLRPTGGTNSQPCGVGGWKQACVMRAVFGQDRNFENTHNFVCTWFGQKTIPTNSLVGCSHCFFSGALHPYQLPRERRECREGTSFPSSKTSFAGLYCNMGIQFSEITFHGPTH